MNFFLRLSTKDAILNNMSNQIDLRSMGKKYFVNCLVINILQNILHSKIMNKIMSLGITLS